MAARGNKVERGKDIFGQTNGRPFPFLRKRSYRKQCPQQPVKPARVIARTARVRIVSALRVKGLKRTNASVLLVRIRMKT